ETALVMLADVVEASVRAASNRSTQSLEQLVERAINERLLEGQLDECNLTLKDLEIIKRSYIRQLQGVYHPRIEYPAPDELEPAPAHLAEPSYIKTDVPSPKSERIGSSEPLSGCRL